ncbi:uncharacterized protein G2W53_017803 [Senna tora]|uniref:Uncharacterized protein n=1 Tax=Senna tora TaxID=362788 RepID=A0A834WR46_9FABA|nr:uncharacterized protein G2W53_017803 [Senna tora]
MEEAEVRERIGEESKLGLELSRRKKRPRSKNIILLSST